jgi:hypothetical protein
MKSDEDHFLFLYRKVKSNLKHWIKLIFSAIVFFEWQPLIEAIHEINESRQFQKNIKQTDEYKKGVTSEDTTTH